MEWTFSHAPTSAESGRGILLPYMTQPASRPRTVEETSIPRIPQPATIELVPAVIRLWWQGVENQLGAAPVLFCSVASGPAALEGCVSLTAALSRGERSAGRRARVAFVVPAIVDGGACCLSAHTYLARSVAKRDEAEMTANRHGASNDTNADAAARFFVKVARQHGYVEGEDFAAVKAAGYSDAQVIEIVRFAVLNTWTNRINAVAQTEIENPVVHTVAA